MKDFFFKIEGRIHARDKDEAFDYLYNLLDNKVERYKIEIEEDKR